MKVWITILLMAFAADGLVADDTWDGLRSYWAEVTRTVNTGDFEGYAALYHPDAVLVTGSAYTGGEGRAVPIASALAGWKPGFMQTKAGEIDANVVFRFTDLDADETSAHMTGIFYYFTVDGKTMKRSDIYVHFEALLVKKAGKWLMVMERQIAPATREEFMGTPVGRPAGQPSKPYTVDGCGGVS